MAKHRDSASSAKVTFWSTCPAYVLLVIVSLNCCCVPLVMAHPQQEFCTEPTRPHPVRCEWFYRCALLPSRTLVWIIDQCRDGQVYRHGSSVPCVTPTDNDGAKCKISPVSGAISGDENAVETLRYGGSSFAPPATSVPKRQQEQVTDRLHGYLLPSILGDNLSGIKILLDSKLNRTNIRSSSTVPVHASEALEDFESSGDNELANEVESQFPEDNNSAYDQLKPAADKSNLVEQEQQHSLESIMNDEWSVLNDMNTRLPLPPDGKILPEHLSQIIEQQNQLNRIAAQVAVPSKDQGPNRRPTGGNAYPLLSTAILSRTPTAAQYDTFDQYKFANGQPGKSPFMPDQIINSIFQISQQMIAQKPPPTTTSVKQSEEPAKRRPVFIPVSSSSSSPSSSSPSLSGSSDATNKHKESKQSTTLVAAKPIGISFVNPTNLKTTMVAHNLQNQTLNNGLAPDGYHTILYDEYGNKFLAKGALKLESAAPIRPTFSEQPPPNAPPPLHPSILSSISPMLQDFTATPSYSFPPLSYNPSPQIHATVDNYSTFGSTIIVPQDESKEPLESEDGDLEEDSASADVAQSDEEFSSPGNSNESSGQSGAEGSEENVSLSQSLFSDLQKPPNQAQDYDQYKDSIMPLLDANPNEVRISVVTGCTGGSRQPNTTDCFKYYVCNPLSGAIHAFTCPAFTAFNKNTRLCDIASFKDCKASQMPAIPPTEAPAVLKRPSTTKGNRVKPSELITAQKYIELMRQQSNKLQTRNKLPQQQQTLALSEGVVVKTISNTVDRNVTRSSSTKGRRKPTPAKRKNANRTRTTPTPTKMRTTTTKTTTSTTTTTPATPKTTRRRKVIRKLPRCRFEGRIPDPKTRSNYYLCHRKSENKFIKVKVSCPAGLVYCPALQYCTASSNC